MHKFKKGDLVTNIVPLYTNSQTVRIKPGSRASVVCCDKWGTYISVVFFKGMRSKAGTWGKQVFELVRDRTLNHEVADE